MGAHQCPKVMISCQIGDEVAKRALVVWVQMGIRLVEDQDARFEECYVGEYLACLKDRSATCVEWKSWFTGLLKINLNVFVPRFIELYGQ